MKYVPLAGRILFTIHFLIAGPMHFSASSVGYATAAGVPAASFLVPFSGILSLLGGLGILLGYKARWAAWLLVAFLVPVNIMMHPFWSVTDPMQRQMMMAFFLNDLSATGAALLIAYFGSGPFSLDTVKSYRTTLARSNLSSHA